MKMNDIVLGGKTYSWQDAGDGKLQIETALGNYELKGGGLCFVRASSGAVGFIPHRGSEQSIALMVEHHYNDNNPKRDVAT